MNALQAFKGQIVRDTKTGKRFEVLGLGRRAETLRLRDIASNEIYFNASARWYEPVGESIEDVALPEIVLEALESETVQRRYERREAEDMDTDDGSMDLYNSRFGDD